MLFFPPFPRFSSIEKEIDECIRDVRNGGFIIFGRCSGKVAALS